MHFSRLFLNRPDHLSTTADTVVVIDVLRSFTTAAMALSRGAKSVYPVEDPDLAMSASIHLDKAVTVGAAPGGAPLASFNFGNSPAALVNADLQSKNVVICTAAGVRGLYQFRQARQLFAASLVCAKATAEAIRKTNSVNVCFVITGEWDDRDGDEDIACADYIESLLKGESTNPESFARRVRLSDFGTRFASGESPNLPVADLDLASLPDLYNFAMRVQFEEQGMVIRPDLTPIKADHL